MRAYIAYRTGQRVREVPLNPEEITNWFRDIWHNPKGQYIMEIDCNEKGENE